MNSISPTRSSSRGRSASLRHCLLILMACLGLGLGFSSIAWGIPTVGRQFPTFAVDDLTRTRRTQDDLEGRWTVVLVMTDKDSGPTIRDWYQRIEPLIPPGGRVITLAALHLFPLVPTATVFARARAATPRANWREVWLSRDGSLSKSLGLPEGENPWVFVVDPSGQVIESIHGCVDDAAVGRVADALEPKR